MKISPLLFLFPAGGHFPSPLCSAGTSQRSDHKYWSFIFMLLRGLFTLDGDTGYFQGVTAATFHAFFTGWCPGQRLSRRRALQSQLPLEGKFLVTWLQSVSLDLSSPPPSLLEDEVIVLLICLLWCPSQSCKTAFSLMEEIWLYPRLPKVDQKAWPLFSLAIFWRGGALVNWSWNLDLCDNLRLASTLTYIILFHLQTHYLHFPENLVHKLSC